VGPTAVAYPLESPVIDSWRYFLDALLASNLQVTDLSWFALQVRSRKEASVANQLGAQGYDCLLPLYKSSRQWSDRVKEVEQPLFPGYLFCKFDFQNRRPLVTTPGVLQIVGIGKTATPIAEAEIAALQLAQVSGLPSQPWPYMELGERVRVNYGNLNGLEGILINFKGNHRVVLSVTLLQRSVAMEVDLSWVTSLKEQRVVDRNSNALARPVVTSSVIG
jgi:transcription antitermination factor NusG